MPEVTQLIGWKVDVERSLEDDGETPIWTLVFRELPAQGHPEGMPTDTYRYAFHQDVRDFIVRGLTGVTLAAVPPTAS